MCIVICTLLLSRPARGAWVEIYIIRYEMELKLSRPARGAWVEMLVGFVLRGLWDVAPRKGRVG